MIGSLAIFPDLGNATILILVSLLMYTISGIAYRWFTTILGLLAGVSMISLTAIRIIGVEKFSKIPVFGYVAKRFSAFWLSTISPYRLCLFYCYRRVWICRSKSYSRSPILLNSTNHFGRNSRKGSFQLNGSNRYWGHDPDTGIC